MDQNTRDQIKDNAVDSVFSTDDDQAAITAVRAALDAGVSPGELIREVDRRVGYAPAAAEQHAVTLANGRTWDQERDFATCSLRWDSARYSRRVSAASRTQYTPTLRARIVRRVRHALHLAA